MSDATDPLADGLWNARTGHDDPRGPKRLVSLQDLRALAQAAYDQAHADLAAAQAVIEQAPHGAYCALGWAFGSRTAKCNCWKSQLGAILHGNGGDTE